MAEPIKVDFRRKRPTSKPTAVKAAPARPAPRPNAEPMVNWRAVPKFAVVLIIMVALMAAWRWFTHGL